MNEFEFDEMISIMSLGQIAAYILANLSEMSHFELQLAAQALATDVLEDSDGEPEYVDPEETEYND